jgi:type I restriction enzyme R subunit
MKQSIFEGFTLDVLSNYTTYKRYFKVSQKEGEDIDKEKNKLDEEYLNIQKLLNNNRMIGREEK